MKADDLDDLDIFGYIWMIWMIWGTPILGNPHMREMRSLKMEGSIKIIPENTVDG